MTVAAVSCPLKLLKAVTVSTNAAVLVLCVARASWASLGIEITLTSCLGGTKRYAKLCLWYLLGSVQSYAHLCVMTAHWCAGR